MEKFFLIQVSIEFKYSLFISGVLVYSKLFILLIFMSVVYTVTVNYCIILRCIFFQLKDTVIRIEIVKYLKQFRLLVEKNRYYK